MVALKINSVSKEFPTPTGIDKILSGVNLLIEKGDIVGIRGGNGIGKTTLFNIISGIEVPTWGDIEIGQNLSLRAVFQNYNSTLLPWLNIKENICIPLKISGLKKTEQHKKLSDLVERLKFNSLPLMNYPHQLSGGEKQKAVIARALIQEPDILILDEPFSNLDIKTIFELQDTIEQIHFFKKITVLISSHNIDHILYLANKIYVLNGNPASLSDEFIIDMPRPRKKDILVSKTFEDLRNKFLEFEYALY